MTFHRITFIALMLASVGSGRAAETVPVIDWSGRLGYGALGYLETRLEDAVENDAPFMVWRLDSTGGELDAVRRITDLLRSSPIPVFVWVGPGEAVLGDEALLIGLAAADIFGSESSRFGTARTLTVTDKGRLTEFEPRSRGYLDELGGLAAKEARKSGYDEDWAVLLVRGLVSLSAWELEAYGIGGGVANNLTDLLELLKQHPLNTAFEFTSESSAWTLEDKSVDILWETLSFIATPDVAFALFLFAMFAFSFTITNPGGLFTPVMGGVLLLVSLLAFYYLPLGYLGIILVVVSMVLFTLEVLFDTKGILAILALGALFAGGMTFYRPGTAGVSLVVLVPSLAVTGVFFLIAVSGGLVAKLRARSIGSGELIGEQGVSTTRIGERGKGKVKLKGDIWPAKALQPIERGNRIRVMGIEGVHLLVEPLPEED